MGLLEMLVGRKLEERDAWKQQKATDESLANAMVAKGNLSPAQLEVIRQIGNKWGSQALMNYYGEAYPQSVANQEAANQQLLRQQQMGQAIQNKVMPMLTGGQQPASMPLGAPTKGVGAKAGMDSANVVGGVDIGRYATAPNHEAAVGQRYQEILAHQGDLDSYIKKVAPNSPLNGQMLVASAQKHGVDPALLAAIIQQDSSFATAGKAVRTMNPGNVGNDDSGRLVFHNSWEEGVDSAAQWLARHKVGEGQQAPPAPAAPPTGISAQTPVPQTPADFGSMLEQMATQMSFNVDHNGGISISGKLGAVPSEEMQKSAYLESIRRSDPGKYNSIMTGMLLKQADMNSDYKVDWNADMGRYVATRTDKATGQVTQIPLDRMQGSETAADKRLADAAAKGFTARQEVLGKEAGMLASEPDRTARELREKSAAYKEPTAKELEGAQGIRYTADRISSKLDQLKRFTGQHDTGAMVVENIPTGPLDAVMQKAQRFGIGDQPTGIMRTQLEGLSTDLMSLLYYISVGNVSDQEMRMMEGLKAAIDQPPHVFVTRLTDVWDMLERRAESQVKTYGPTGKDVRGQQEALDFLRKTNPLKMFPKAYQDILGPAPRGNLADEWGAMKGGK